MKVTTIGVPLKYGCDIKGADLGIYELEKSIKFDQIINIEKLSDVSDLLHYHTVLSTVNKVACMVNKALIDNDFPLVIGGDHSLAIGSIAGSSAYSKIGVLWVDSHGDINTHLTTISKRIHGMPLATSFGDGPLELVNCFKNGAKVDTSDIVIFGCSDLDEAEKEIILKYQIKVLTCDYIKEIGIVAALEEVISYLKGKRIHFSFDIDSMDPKIYTGCSVRTKHDTGLSSSEIKYLIDEVFSNLFIQSVDLVEYNPLNDTDEITKSQFIEVYNQICTKIMQVI